MSNQSDTTIPILDPVDLQSSCWVKMRKFLMDRKLSAMTELSNPNCGPAKTELLRARIVEIDALLGLDPRMSTAEVRYQFR